MPRTLDIDTIISKAVAEAFQKIAPALQRHVASLAAEQLETALSVRATPALRGAARRTRAPVRARAEITQWVTDRRARRVPKFVIGATGLDTKKKIVAKYGENATFEKGKPLPKAKAA